ncbi:5040_t:CDS:2 [Gigaspora margarita]|uniref:5040_t:CDS:1 n=1 Tax=Gigaspora margarita TaxID=4874 RepID=A0ABN7UQK5_GIGMA|nr:5040_t:CDS:2 [Gigaspora margarita]
MEGVVNNCNIDHEITIQQKREAYNILLDNHNIFATDISESGQTIELDALSQMYEGINVSDNEEILQNDFEKDPIDFLNQTIEEPVELLMIITYKAQEIVLITNGILQIIKDMINYCPVTDVRPYCKINFDLTG